MFIFVRYHVNNFYNMITDARLDSAKTECLRYSLNDGENIIMTYVHVAGSTELFCVQS